LADDNTSRTFLFTDIEGSSQLWEEQPVAMRAALAWHDRELRRIVEAEGGEVVKRTGDGIHASFADPLAALRAAADIQRCIQAPPEGVTLPLALRCGLHCGYDERRDGDYFGTDVNRAARVMSVSHGGQILLSQAVRQRVEARLPEDWRLTDLGRVRLRGFAQAERLSQLCAPGLRESFPALRAMEEAPHNLPAASTRFFNRVRELQELAQLLPSERLVLLHGLGGMGKTRLALEAARAAREHFEDGVWFVELAQTTDAALVPLALASVLGVKEEAGRTLTDALVRTLAPRRALIVLDNCEQVVDACAQLVDELLARAPQLHVLVTSREHLRLTAERVVEVGGFELPAAGGRLAWADLAQVAAVSLFVDRVRAAQPGFELSAESAEPVTAICRRLDGIPLALELAAATARRMPLQRLAERLEDRLGTLVHGQRVASERQKTLRGLIDWSHDLLTPAQQQVFQQLGVFAGGWTLEAAEAVCESAELPREDVIERLGELVEKSLVRLDLVSGRYDMLDTVRQYAREKLQAGTTQIEAQTRHLEWYLALAETARPHLGGLDQRTWLAQLDAERDNLLAAHQACARLPQGAERGVRLSWAIKPYWLNRGLLGLGLRVATEALERLPPAATTTRAAALADVGQLCFFVGQYQHAQSYLGQCIALCRPLGNDRLEAAALQPLGMACLAFRQDDEAERHLVAARELALRLGNASFQGYIESAMGQLLRVKQRYADALSATRAARELAQSLGDQDLLAITWLNEAMIALSQSGAPAVPGAILLLQRVLAACEQGRSQQLIQSALEVATGAACELGRWSEAAEFWSWAEAMARHSGLKRDPADEAFVAGHVARMEQALGPAALRQRVRDADLQPDLAVISRLQQWALQAQGALPQPALLS
jgi:predicted ATPase/class 3 adenylate cyclase